MMTMLIIAVKLIGIAFLCSLLSFFLDFTFREGAIFGVWLNFIARKLVKFFNKQKYLLINKMPKESQDFEFINEADTIPLFQPLGRCIVCSNVWQTIIIYSSIFYFLNLNFWFVFIVILLSSFFLRIIINER